MAKNTTGTKRTAEQDLRLEIFNTLLTTPHRDFGKLAELHREMAQMDPLFYVRLAAWYAEKGDVRDHKELFTLTLCLSEFEGHREVGLALLRQMPPYQVGRVVDYIHGQVETRTVREKVRQKEPKAKTKTKAKVKADRKAKKAKTAVAVSGADGAETKPAETVRTETVRKGLFRNVPRSVKTEVTRYIREREADAQWFDSSVLIARKSLKRLYAVLHVRPSDRAQKILFDREPPADSRLFALRMLARAESPADQARAIVEHSIPYRVASTVVKQMTPTVLLALIESMSPQEVINNLGSLKKRGALDNADLKARVEHKLEAAKGDARVSAFKATEAAAAAGVSGEVREKLEAVTDTRLKAKGRITRPTALLVDKSASMHDAIELGKRIGAMISTVCESDLFVYAFDTMAYEIARQGEDLAAWEKAFRGITAGGATSAGAAVAWMAKKRQKVEQFIVVTDEGENTHPLLAGALAEYKQALAADPSVVIVRTPGGTGHMESALRHAGVGVDVFRFEGDYYALPNLVPLLSRPGKLELLMEIMDWPLPKRLAA
jgi:hypothetical protein